MFNLITQKGGIFFENIQEGFENYNFETKKLNKEDAFAFIKALMAENGEENSFCDFYYKTLDEKARAVIENNLETEEMEYIKELCEIEGVFYKLNEKLLKIITKLNEGEILFSTVYFTKNPSTFWGNYNKEYVIFTNKNI